MSKEWGVQHFRPSEFDSADAPGTGAKMDPAFIQKLDVLRMLCGFPFKINSGFRTPERNKLAGGKSDSEHLRGLGADIQVHTSQARHTLLKYAYALEFERIGIAKTYIHLGADETLPLGVTWLY